MKKVKALLALLFAVIITLAPGFSSYAAVSESIIRM